MKDGCTATMVFLMYLMYPTLCRQAFALLMCKQVGDHQYLMADLQEVCWEGRHLWWILFCSLPQIFLHVIGFPLVGLIVVYQRKKVRHHDHDKSFSGAKQIRLKNNLASSISLFKFGMLYSAYAPRRWYWDAVIAFKKAAIAFVTSFVSVPELEVHWIVVLMGSFILLNEFGKPYNHPSRKRAVEQKGSAGSERNLGAAKKKKKKRNYVRTIMGTGNQEDPGEELQRLDSLTLYVSMVTSWSGLFFILFPYCSENDIGCGMLLVSIMAFNILFLVYCILLFRSQIVSETKRFVEIVNRKCNCLRKVDPKEEEERQQRERFAKAIEMRRSDVHGNPLVYRKSFVVHQNTTNPIAKLDRSSVMMMRRLKQKSNLRRSNKIKQLAAKNRSSMKKKYSKRYQYTRVIVEDGKDYYYYPRTREKRLDDPMLDWVSHEDDSGKVYYCNKRTNEVQWNDPAVDEESAWDRATDELGDTYFYHKKTDEVRWDDPDDPWALMVDPDTQAKYYFHKHTKEVCWLEEKLKMPAAKKGGGKTPSKQNDHTSIEITNPMMSSGTEEKKQKYV